MSFLYSSLFGLNFLIRDKMTNDKMTMTFYSHCYSSLVPVVRQSVALKWSLSLRPSNFKWSNLTTLECMLDYPNSF